MGSRVTRHWMLTGELVPAGGPKRSGGTPMDFTPVLHFRPRAELISLLLALGILPLLSRYHTYIITNLFVIAQVIANLNLFL